ncbi:hypothetical protein [Flavisphingomonas formosensis]|uniref:hypothetical protein n=1 Tax=Flavisphingomonas formosensis TaxID=861534 RepID=UPI0012FBFD71|nr:hypothetical protein [Sphingomonas formosensis]
MASREHVVRSANGVDLVRIEHWHEGRFVMSYIVRTRAGTHLYEDAAAADAAWLAAIGDDRGKASELHQIR